MDSLPVSGAVRLFKGLLGRERGIWKGVVAFFGVSVVLGVLFGVLTSFASAQANTGPEVSGVVHCDGNLEVDGVAVPSYAVMRVVFGSSGEQVAVVDLSGMCGDDSQAGLVYLSMPEEMRHPIFGWFQPWVGGNDHVFFVQGGLALANEGLSWDQEEMFSSDSVSVGVMPVVGDEGVKDFIQSWWSAAFEDDHGALEDNEHILDFYHPAVVLLTGEFDSLLEVSGLAGDAPGQEDVGDGYWSESLGVGGVSVLIIGSIILGCIVYYFAGGRKPVLAAVVTLGASLGIGAETSVITDGVVYVYGGVCVMIISAALFRRIGWGGS